MQSEHTVRSLYVERLRKSLDSACVYTDKGSALAYEIGLLQSLLVELMIADSLNYDRVYKQLNRLKEQRNEQS